MCATHRMLRVRAVVVTALWPASVRRWRVDTLCAHVELSLACVCTRANRTSPSTTHPPNPTELRDIKTRACRALEDRGNTGTLEGAALPVPRASCIDVEQSRELSLLPSMRIQCIACLRGVGLACVLGLTSVRLHAARTEHTDVPQPCRLAWVAAPFNATLASLASSFVLDGFLGCAARQAFVALSWARRSCTSAWCVCCLGLWVLTAALGNLRGTGTSRNLSL